jgi:hypothetical protein
MSLVDQPEVAAVATDARERLVRVVEGLAPGG